MMNLSPPQYSSSYSRAPGQAEPRHSQLESSKSSQNLTNDLKGVYRQKPGSDSNTRDVQSYASSNARPSMPHQSDQSGTKRKRPVSSRILSKDERKKVSRACDCCKSRKLRCTGTQPCSRCSKQGLVCEYNALHRRGKPPSPEPAEPFQILTQESVSSVSVTNPQVQDGNPSALPATSQADDLPTSSQLRKSSRSSQEPEETRFEGHYIGPTSGIAFLHRAQRRFKQDFAATISSGIYGRSSPQSSVFSFGDGYYPKYSAFNLKFPPKQQAKHLVDRYFDFAMPTYRFLHRATVESWVDRLCDENENKAVNGPALSNAKVALVLLTLATATLYEEDATGSLIDSEADDCEQSGIYFAAAEQRIANETGPVRLESVQVRLAQCIYLLGSSRINQAWYTFGTASQMLLALGIHRKRFSQSFGASSGLVEIEMRKRVFWSAYTLDKYLSVILGRPRVFRDEDIDQLFPDRLNDADLTANAAKPKSAQSQCVSDGPVFHAKLVRIVGKISSDLYPTNKILGTDWIQTAQQRTAELKAWKESLPPFLEPDKVDPTMLIPIFQRQSTVLRLAYLNALILANRQSLLSNFADLNRSQNLPSGELESSLKECIDAASAVVDTVNGFIEQSRMRKPFWFTHYISFCAISTLYVYTIQKSQPGEKAEGPNNGSSPPMNHFEAAERCQRNIYRTTAPSSPFRRYNIILDELKKEVLLRLAKATPPSNTSLSRPEIVVQDQTAVVRPPYLIDSSGETTNRTPNNNAAYPMDFGAVGQLVDERNQLLISQSYSQNYVPMGYRTSGTPTQMFDDSMMDLGLFGPQSEFVGWAELDSCAIAWPDGLEYDSWNV